MNHPTGSTLSAVQSTLDSTPGSFWTDGTTMYAHPFGDTNPGGDGKDLHAKVTSAALLPRMPR